MNSSIHIQLVKWTVPAVAFVIALFWYRRRQIDKTVLERNDPGGDPGADLIEGDTTVLSDCKKIDISRHESGKDFQGMDKENNQRMDIQSSINCDCIKTEELTRVQVKTNENEILMNEQQYTDMPGDRYFSMPSHEMNNTVEQVANESPDENKQMYYDTQPSQQQQQQQYVTNEYMYGESSQQEKGHIEGHVCDRDSANISPFSGVSGVEGTVTPDETRSEGSLDSGKGGSINGNKKNIPILSTHDFAIPQNLVGRLIGRQGNFFHNIRSKANVAVYLTNHPYDDNFKICSIQGNADEINFALKLIRQKFPEKKFPQLILEEISTPEILISYVPTLSSLALIDGINNDISVSHIVKPNWLFVNLPTHPSFLSLPNLESEMLLYYNSKIQSMNFVNVGDYVAVFWNEKWVRARVQKSDNSRKSHVVQLLDHGGYWPYKTHEIKPLLPNYMALPFQAIEIFLANIQSKNETWLQSAYDMVSAVCKSYGIGQAQVEGYIANNVYINIYYTFNNSGVFSLADELIAKGYAEPVTWDHMRPEKVDAIFQ